MTKLMGVLNVNEDSFYKESRFVGDEAVGRIEKMIVDGASIIDIGGVSSRPGSKYVGASEEMRRVKPIIDAIHKNRLHNIVRFSIDSFEPTCIDYALTHGFSIVNDITGLKDDDVARVAARHKASVCIMHMQNSPENMQEAPFYEDVVLEVEEFFLERSEKARSFGIEDIILDVGIGFGKTLEHNLLLINAQERYKRLGYELLIGASRKSMIDKIHPSPVEERLPGTIILHLEAVRNGASIVRCHDVKEHAQAFSVYYALQGVK